VVTENTELMGKKAAAGDLTLSLSPTSSGLPGKGTDGGFGLGLGYRDLDSQRSTSSLGGIIGRPPTRGSSTSYSGYERLPVQRHQIQLISLLGQQPGVYSPYTTTATNPDGCEQWRPQNVRDGQTVDHQ